MIRSMTGYAGIENSMADSTVRVEIRTVNSRHLDLSLRLPDSFAAIEDKIRPVVSRYIFRGRVELRINTAAVADRSCMYQVNFDKARAYFDALQTLQRYLQIGGDISPDALMQKPGLIVVQDPRLNVDTDWPVIEDALNTALTALNDMRQCEGDAIAADFVERLAWIEQTLDDVEKQATVLPEIYQRRLSERITALTRGIAEIDPARIAQEAAILADKADISEEIVRARSHISQFRTIMASDEPGGRKLNFLIQELNREFNTMGTKAANAAVSHQIVAVKAELEKLREQIQNVE